MKAISIIGLSILLVFLVFKAVTHDKSLQILPKKEVAEIFKSPQAPTNFEVTEETIEEVEE